MSLENPVITRILERIRQKPNPNTEARALNHEQNRKQLKENKLDADAFLSGNLHLTKAHRAERLGAKEAERDRIEPIFAWIEEDHRGEARKPLYRDRKTRRRRGKAGGRPPEAASETVLHYTF